MAGIAKVMLIGNLGRDPETRYTPNGAINVQFTLATNRRWTDQSGQQHEKTTWFRVTAWRRLAETLDQLTQSGALAKGRQVFVLGSLETREYQDQNGVNRISLDVTADEFQLLGSRLDGEQMSARAGGARPEPEDVPSDLDDVPF